MHFGRIRCDSKASLSAQKVAQYELARKNGLDSKREKKKNSGEFRKRAKYQRRTHSGAELKFKLKCTWRRGSK